MDGRLAGYMNGQIARLMDGRLAGYINGWIARWMDGWLAGWMNGWIAVRLAGSVVINVYRVNKLDCNII